MRQSKHEFRVTLVLDREVDNWFITQLFSGAKNKGYKITNSKTKQEYLLGCYKAYVNVLSNGDRIVNLYFEGQSEEEYEGLNSVLDDLSKQGIGWVVYD